MATINVLTLSFPIYIVYILPFLCPQLLLAAGYGSRSRYGHQSGFGARGNLDSVPLCLGMSQGSSRHSRHGAGNLHKSKSSFC